MSQTTIQKQRLNIHIAASRERWSGYVLSDPEECFECIDFLTLCLYFCVARQRKEVLNLFKHGEI